MLNLAPLDSAIAEGRLIRNAWTGTDARGRQTVCLLAALSPEVAESERASACPAELMPRWMAALVPDLDDRGTLDAWSEMIATFRRSVERWHLLTPVAWERLRWRWLRICVLEARSHVEAGLAVLPAIDAVVGLIDRQIGGDTPTAEEWRKAAARAAASAAEEALAAEEARVARVAAAGKARVVAAAARAAEEAAARATRVAAEAAARAAAARAAASAAEEALVARLAAARAARAEARAWDRMTVALFAAIDLELALLSAVGRD